MEDLSGRIARFYDSQPEYEWARMERHRTEYAVTLWAMEQHLPPPPARILDCGGGPGRYSIELTRRGYQVTLFDLSAGNLALARQKAQQAGVTLQGIEQGTAVDLSRFEADTFDAVLLMGPLYHLLDLEDRQRALVEARRVLKPGGILLAAFITRYSAHRWSARQQPDWIVQKAESSQQLLETGCLLPEGGAENQFVAYMAHPKEIPPLFGGLNLDVKVVLGVEGLISEIEDGVNALEGEAWERWVALNARLAADPALHGAAEHLLVIAVKPRWRTVLRQIAGRLNQAGLNYTVVGGMAAVLHGVPLAVKDIDIEMDASDAYRFQELFPGQVVEAVSLSDNGQYRSHFGRFDFDGVTVEVMGELHRWEDGQWLSTRPQTHTVINLDGVPVRVCWLEEETLAYMRRGRLERAAQCLVHCRTERLMALLRGAQSTRVL